MMTTTARVSGDHYAGRLELELDYDGVEPPNDLFFRLTRDGWQVPAPVPPPAEVIDWTIADRSTGTPYTIHSFPVIAAVALAPMAASSGTDALENHRSRIIAELTRTLVSSGFERMDGCTWIRGKRTTLTVEVDPQDVEPLAALLCDHHRGAILSIRVVEDFRESVDPAVIASETLLLQVPLLYLSVLEITVEDRIVDAVTHTIEHLSDNLGARSQVGSVQSRSRPV